MRTALSVWAVVMSLWLTSPALFAGDNALTVEEEAAGWQLLFNGNDASGWKCNNDKQPSASVVEDADSEVEALARDLVESGERGHDVDTPFAWTQEDPEETNGGGPPIRDYFDGLLGWRRRGDLLAQVRQLQALRVESLLLLLQPGPLGLLLQLELARPRRTAGDHHQGNQARYVPTGHLVYARRGTLYAAPFDTDRLEVTANPVPVIVGVDVSLGSHYYDVSETGTLVYRPAPRHDRRLVLVDLDGRVEALAAPPLPYGSVRFSPDGGQLVATTDDGGTPGPLHAALDHLRAGRVATELLAKLRGLLVVERGHGAA